MKNFKKLVLGVSLSVMVGGVVHAEDNMQFQVGYDSSSGNYGGTQKTTTSAQVYMMKMTTETGWTLKASVPYVTAEGFVNSNTGVASSNRKISQKGMGDLTIAASAPLTFNKDGGLDATVKVKLATADEKNTLITTGKTDYTFQLDGYQKLTKDTVFLASVGVKKFGNPDGVTFKTAPLMSLGLQTKLADGVSVGVNYDYRAKILDNRPNYSEVMGYVKFDATKDVSITGYVSSGLTDAAADSGGGVLLGVKF